MQNNRYKKQIQLPEIGISGQQKLTQAKVLVIGAGGLGCPVLQNLVAAGVGCIGIVDGDVVEETNLHRQFLYTLNECGKNKATVATEVVSNQNPEVKVISYPTYFTQENAFEIVSDYQIIADCTDNLMTRYLINDIALVKNIPMVYASIHKFEGQLAVFNYESGPTYRCLFPDSENLKEIPNCNDSGVLGVLPNTLGVMQANEVLKIILEIGEVLSGKLVLYNGLNTTFQTINFQVNKTEKEKGIQNGLAILNQSSNNGIVTITSDDFFTKLANKENLVIDIRENYEEPKLAFENIKLVPLSALENFLENTIPNQKIILFCQVGDRSKLAAQYLIKKGFTTIFHLQNGIEALKKTTI
jgi:molybdopterin/thiamine biosynthesis adenylyltransferase/rhodanese-related sulfurtransferase